jgi:serine/threonine protein kinase
VTDDLWEPSAGDVVDSRYRLEERLARGGASVAWRAVDVDEAREVTVRHPRCEPESMDRIREALDRFLDICSAATDRGGSKHVPEPLDRFEERDRQFAVVSFVEGAPLDQLDAGDLPVGEIRRLGIELASLARFMFVGLGRSVRLYAENLLVTDEERVLLTFYEPLWIAKEVEDLPFSGPSRPTQPPETKHPDADRVSAPASHVYAVGRLLLWLLLGSVPRQSGICPSEFGLDVPDWLDGLVATATARDPADRYSNPTVLRRCLERRTAEPPEGATLTHVQGESHHEVRPGDTLGRASAWPSASLVVGTDGDYLPAAAAVFDRDEDGGWSVESLGPNGLYHNRGDGTGWTQVVSGSGREALAERDLLDEPAPPTSVDLEHGDLVAFVHPEYGLSYLFGTA